MKPVYAAPQVRDEAVPTVAKVIPEPRQISKKLIAVVIVVILVGVSFTVIWAAYFSARSIEDIAGYVINDPSPAAPGFKHGLAGDKVIVKGRVTNITTHTTTQGNMSFVELDNFVVMHLVVWGEVPYDVGDRIRTDIRFEWSVCNDESHVYSPQLDFPVYAYLTAIDVVLRAVAAVAGSVMNISSSANGTVALEVFDQNPVLPLDELNCSLRVGHSSFAGEYIDVLGIGTPGHTYGREVDSLSSLTTGTSHGGNISFIDADQDGNLSRHDTFELRNLSMPGHESGAYTYVLIIGIDPSLGLSAGDVPITYIVMTSTGVLRIEGTPYARIENDSVSPTEARFTFVRAEAQTSWNDIQLMFTDGTYFGYWYPSAGNLDNGSVSQTDLPSVTLGGTQWTCRVVDEAGDGLLNEGDHFAIMAGPGSAFSPETNYTVTVLHEPTAMDMAHLTFHG